MKSVLKIFLLIFLPVLAQAQNEQNYEDSLKTALRNAVNDTIRLDINRQLGFYHQDSEPDTGLIYHQSQLVLAKKLNLKLWQADACQQIAYCYFLLDNLPASFEFYMNGLKIAEDPISASNDWGYFNFSYSKSPEEARRSIEGMIRYELANLYNRTRLLKEARFQMFEALRIGEGLQNRKILSLSSRDLGVSYFINNKSDSAFFYYQKALSHYQYSPYQKGLGTLYEYIGRYYFQQQQFDSSKQYYQKAMANDTKNNSLISLGNAKQAFGELYKTTGQLDSALAYTFKANKIADSINDYFGMAVGYTQLGSIYKLQKKHALAYDFLEKGKIIADSINDAYISRLMQFQNIGFNQKIRLQELEKESEQTKSRIRIYALLAGLGIFLLVALLLYRNNRQKQKTNKLLASTLKNLKSTQSQLIQSEKMASLGELTAGIAHEIQNPLNFVNNFSEVNTELIEEAGQEIERGNVLEVKTILNDIRENEQKINHHGKRAEAIVRGMLQHSRSSSGVKESTDINALVDEYLRLAYHGFRAKDKTLSAGQTGFNTAIETDYDKSIGSISIIPQDIGRVILNLINNAFYAVDERQKHQPNGYVPTVLISTKKAADTVLISVKDNGNGIPPKVFDKIFQPFFTTKPTGQGTGLGLSLAYDIVKAHGGELKVETREGEETTFIITL